jgi:hypothetical protein
MSNPSFPPETLDYIIDLLYCQPDTLKRCCLVSKSWVPRTRKHLFAQIILQTEEHLRSWKEMFPNPSTSPARYAKTLFVGCPQVVVAVDAEADGWLRGFSRVVRLVVHGDGPFSLLPFHGLSPVIKFLRVSVSALPSSRIINLVHSFPLLEDLVVVVSQDTPADAGVGSAGVLTAVQPSSPPMLTGSLELYVRDGMELVARRLLSLPGGIHFRKLTLTWFHEADCLMAMALVEGCSHTLESLDLSDFCGTSVLRLRPRR